MIRVGGQCEGYGGIFAALQQHLPAEHAWYAEVDEAASKVLAHHYPGVPNHGDITAVDWAEVGRAGRADGGLAVLTAGWPCQPFSAAGKRAGTSDERHLWPTGVLPAVTALRPRLFIGENVPGLLTIERGQVFGRVLADLDDLGYTVSWTTVGACRVGACHHRHRVFIAATLAEVRSPMSDPVAHRAGEGWGPAQTVLFGDVSAVRWPASGFTAAGTVWELPVTTCSADRGALFPTPTATPYGNNQSQSDGAAVRPSLDGVVQLLPTPRTSDTNGVGVHGSGGLDLRTAVSMFPTPTARDATRGAGRTFAEGRPLSEVIALLPTPTVADSRGTRNATAGRTALKPTTNNNGWTLGDVIHDGRIGSAVQPERFGVYAQAVARHERAYGLVAPDPTEPGRLGKPRLAPEFPSFMQGLPPGWLTDVVGRKDAIRLAGNGVNPRQAAYAMGTLPTFRAAVAALTLVEVAA